jgi:hypothetical protein
VGWGAQRQPVGGLGFLGFVLRTMQKHQRGVPPEASTWVPKASEEAGVGNTPGT